MKHINKVIGLTLGLSMILILGGCSKAPVSLVLTGNVEGKNIEIKAQASGQLTGIFVKEGDKVSGKDLLAQIDDRELVLKRDNLELARQIAELKYQDLKNGNSKALIRQAIANRDQVKAQLAGSQKEIDYLKKQLSDAQALVGSGANAPQQETDFSRALDKELSRYEALSDQLKGAQEGLNLTLEGAVTEKLKQALLEIQMKSNEIAQMNLAVDKTKVISPSAGIVQTANFESGEIVQAGQTLFSITDPSVLKLKVYVNEKNLSRIQVGMPVRLSGDFSASEAVTGKVEYISEEAEFTPKNIESKESKQEMVYEVRILIEDSIGLIKPGMYLDADFEVIENGN